MSNPINEHLTNKVMVRVGVDSDSVYPIYFITVVGEGEYKIPKEKLEWIKRVDEEWWAVQDYLAEINKSE